MTARVFAKTQAKAIAADVLYRDVVAATLENQLRSQLEGRPERRPERRPEQRKRPRVTFRHATFRRAAPRQTGLARELQEDLDSGMIWSIAGLVVIACTCTVWVVLVWYLRCGVEW